MGAPSPSYKFADDSADYVAVVECDNGVTVCRSGGQSSGAFYVSG